MKIKNALFTLAFPMFTWIIVEILCRILMGRHVFNTILDVQNYVRNVGISACTALALSYNLSHGRFELSLGAPRMMVAIIGGNLAIRIGFGTPGVILFVLAFGLIFGALTGFVFVITRIPAMALGVGIALVYECIAFVGSSSRGLQLYGVKGVENLSNMYLTIFVTLAAVLFVMVSDRYTKFGFYARAINGSQRIAASSGINIFAHAIGSYTFAGAMVSFSGVFDAAFKGGMDAELGFASNSTVMTNCFPMYLGKFISRWSSESAGILFATMTIKIFETGLSVMKVSVTGQQVWTMGAFLVFLVIRANEDRLNEHRALKARIKAAQAKRIMMVSA
jgi:ribose/xylose/arabinose/galactoside ABC-type transport system permease subunit